MPKIVDHDIRREEIAVLTLRVIRKVGIEKASIRGIARQGGLSMGVLTHYFRTKDDLIVFTFRWMAEQTFAQLDQLLTVHPPGLPQLAAAIDANFPKRGEPAALSLWMSLWGRAVRNRAFALEHRNYYRRWRGYVKKILRDAIELKQAPRSQNIDTATDLIVAAVDGLWLAMTLEPSRFAKHRRRILLEKLLSNATR